MFSEDPFLFQFLVLNIHRLKFLKKKRKIIIKLMIIKNRKDMKELDNKVRVLYFIFHLVLTFPYDTVLDLNKKKV